MSTVPTRPVPRLAAVLAPGAAVYVEADRPLAPDAPPLPAPAPKRPPAD
jgi:hypothetical protein